LGPGGVTFSASDTLPGYENIESSEAEDTGLRGKFSPDFTVHAGFAERVWRRFPPLLQLTTGKIALRESRTGQRAQIPGFGGNGALYAQIYVQIANFLSSHIAVQGDRALQAFAVNVESGSSAIPLSKRAHVGQTRPCVTKEALSPDRV
jgi:hypothetical protein